MKRLKGGGLIGGHQKHVPSDWMCVSTEHRAPPRGGDLSALLGGAAFTSRLGRGRVNWQHFRVLRVQRRGVSSPLGKGLRQQLPQLLSPKPTDMC